VDFIEADIENPSKNVARKLLREDLGAYLHAQPRSVTCSAFVMASLMGA